MSFELQIDAKVGSRILRPLVDDTLAEIRVRTVMEPWVDRIDRDGDTTVDGTLVRVPGMLFLTDRADVTASPNQDPLGPTTRSGSVALEATLGWDAGNRPTVTYELGTSVAELPSTVGTVSFDLPLDASLNSMTGFDGWRVGVHDDRLSVFLWSMDTQRHIPDGHDWCLAIPLVFVKEELRKQLVAKNITVEPEYELVGTTPTFKFATTERYQLDDPLPAVDGRVEGRVSLGLVPGPSGVGTWLGGILDVKITPLGGGLVGLFAGLAGPLTRSDVLRFRPAPAFLWNGVRMTVDAIVGTSDHVVLAGACSSPSHIPPSAPTFATQPWSPLMALGSLQPGLPKSAVSGAHIAMRDVGSIVSVELPSEGPLAGLIYLIPPPSIEARISGASVELTAVAEAIEAREAAMGQIPFEVLVHGTRGHRLIRLSAPPHPERNTEGEITNAIVIPPELVPIDDLIPGPPGPPVSWDPSDPGDGQWMIVGGRPRLQIPNVLRVRPRWRF